jgi:hypothetical protein
MLQNSKIIKVAIAIASCPSGQADAGLGGKGRTSRRGLGVDDTTGDDHTLEVTDHGPVPGLRFRS